MAGRTGHLARFNAFYERGWNRACTPTQREVWLVYEKHARNATGLAKLKAETLAMLLGHSTISHVGEARKALVAIGLLEVVNDGGKGPKDVVEVRVLVPEVNAPPKSRRAPRKVSDGSEIGNLVKTVRFPVSENKVPSFGAQGSQFRKPVYIDELRNELRNELRPPTEEPDAPASGLFAGGEDEDDGKPAMKPTGHPKPAGRKKPAPTRTPEEHAAYEACWAWWCDTGWPTEHEGLVYESTAIAADRAALWKILARSSIAYDPTKFKALASVYLGRPAALTRSHTLYGMVPLVMGLETDVARQRNGKPHAATGTYAPGRFHRPAQARQRVGEFPENLTL